MIFEKPTSFDCGNYSKIYFIYLMDKENNCSFINYNSALLKWMQMQRLRQRQVRL